MVHTVYCPQCGNPSPLGQKFCEKCGSKLPDQLYTNKNPEEQAAFESNSQIIMPPPGSAPSTSYIQNTIQQNPGNFNTYQQPGSKNRPAGLKVGQPMGLFDPSHRFYIIKEKFWDWGSGPIYDEHGWPIGKMHRVLLSLRKRIEFQEMDGRIIAYIAKKLVSLNPFVYDLHTPDDVRIARLSKTILSIFRPRFELKDDSGQILFCAVGNFMGFDFNIFAGPDENPQYIVGEIHKADRWRDIFLGGAFDFSDTYALQVHNPTVDRRLLLGFVIAIDNVMHDN